MYFAMVLITIVLLYILYLRAQLHKTERKLRALQASTIVVGKSDSKSGKGMILAAGLVAFLMAALANVVLP